MILANLLEMLFSIGATLTRHSARNMGIVGGRWDDRGRQQHGSLSCEPTARWASSRRRKWQPRVHDTFGLWHGSRLNRTGHGVLHAVLVHAPRESREPTIKRACCARFPKSDRWYACRLQTCKCRSIDRWSDP